MRTLYAVMRAITCVNEWVGRVTAYLILPIFLLILAEVFLRYWLGAPAIWTNELSQLIFGVYVIMGGGYLAITDGHVNVDIIHSRFPVRVRALIDILTSVLFFIFLGALLYFGTSMALESLQAWERSHSPWNPPIWPVKLMIPVAAALLLLQGVAKLVKDILVATGVASPTDRAVDGGPEGQA